MPLEQRLCKPVLVVSFKRLHRLLCACKALQSRIVKENSVSLRARYDEESRPFLVEGAAIAIDESRNCLQFGSLRRYAARQGLRKG